MVVVVGLTLSLVVPGMSRAVALTGSGPEIGEPLVTASTPVPDLLVDTGEEEPGGVPRTGGPVTRSEPPAARSDAPAGAPATPSPSPEPGEDPDPAGAAGSTRTSHLVLAVLAVAAALLASASMLERLRPPGRRRRPDRAGRTPARGVLRVAPGTARPPEDRLPPVAEDGVVALPVLALPEEAQPSWTQLHDLVDAWTWHQSWLAAGRGARVVVPVDGLVIGRGLDAEDPRIHDLGLVKPLPDGPSRVAGVEEGIILSRPAACSVRDLTPRLRREVEALAAAARYRAWAAAARAHSLVGFPLAVLLPVVAVLLGSPIWVVALAVAPTAVGLVTALLRWAALDEVDRATTLRIPLPRGFLLVATGPIHAALRWVAAWAALRSPAPIPLARVVRIEGVRRESGTGLTAERPSGRRSPARPTLSSLSGVRERV
jgi:hypothetical protein